MVVVCSILPGTMYVHSLAYYSLFFSSLAGQTLPSMLLLLHNHGGNGLVRLDRFCICVECVECHVIDRNSSVTPECTEKADPLYLFACPTTVEISLQPPSNTPHPNLWKDSYQEQLCVQLFLRNM